MPLLHLWAFVACPRLKFNFALIFTVINTLNAELNPICHLLALLGAHHFLHVSRIRVKLCTHFHINYFFYMPNIYILLHLVIQFLGIQNTHTYIYIYIYIYIYTHTLL